MERRKVRVLIADDEPHIRELLKLMVGTLGAEVVAEAADGEQALELFRRLRPDLVMLDINMPRLSGEEALEQIVRIDPRVPVVMLTAQDSIDTVNRCLELGARNYILKSTDPEAILALIRESWHGYLSDIRESKGEA